MKRMKEIERTFNINLSKPEGIKSDIQPLTRPEFNIKNSFNDPFANDNQPLGKVSPRMSNVSSKPNALKMNAQRSVAMRTG